MLQAAEADKSCNDASDCINFCPPTLLPACLEHVCVCVHAQDKFARRIMNENNHTLHSDS